MSVLHPADDWSAWSDGKMGAAMYGSCDGCSYVCASSRASLSPCRMNGSRGAFRRLRFDDYERKVAPPDRVVGWSDKVGLANGNGECRK